MFCEKSSAVNLEVNEGESWLLNGVRYWDSVLGAPAIGKNAYRKLLLPRGIRKRNRALTASQTTSLVAFQFCSACVALAGHCLR
jgi:hypothetical protein